MTSLLPRKMLGHSWTCSENAIERITHLKGIG